MRTCLNISDMKRQLPVPTNVWTRHSRPVGCVFILFLTTRRPPIATLFPYTTLFRSVVGHHRPALAGAERGGIAQRLHAPPARRSEEHTSELQSHSELVCRLLLEKKRSDR